MDRPKVASECTTSEREALYVECTHCQVQMTSHVGSGRQIRYFHCPSCSRWTTSVYTEVLKGDTKMRSRHSDGSQARSSVGSVKERLESWLQALSGNDPYHILGVTPDISDAALRERYLALARTHHPDKGGVAEEMRRINEAYERLLAHRAQRRAGQLATAMVHGFRRLAG